MTVKSRASAKRLLSTLIVVLAVGYPATLFLLVLLLRFVGEAWWVTGLALYLPRLGWALPLLLLVPALVLARRRRLLALQGVSVLLLLFPLLGLTLNVRGEATEPKLRVLSFNISMGDGGMPRVIDEATAHGADVVLLQEAPPWRADEMKALLGPKFAHVRVDEQFVIASKFPVLEVTPPARIPFQGQQRSPRFLRYVLETPLGRITVFSLHTVSPRGAFQAMRGDGLRREILSGRLLRGAHAQSLQDTTALQALQVEALVELAGRERQPVLIVGDSNMPTLSRNRERLLSRFRDGFAEAGLGFGNTFPSRFPWMRIDLLLASHELVFERVEVGTSSVSDHACIYGDVRKGS